jgi:uncharacterized protein (TIGR02145 family)
MYIRLIILSLLIFCNNLLAQEVKKIKLGTQTWMQENLNLDKFSNGESIPEAKTNKEWENAGKNQQPAWCYYENDSKRGSKYGKLYNWYAVNDSRGLAYTIVG